MLVRKLLPLFSYSVYSSIATLSVGILRSPLLCFIDNDDNDDDAFVSLSLNRIVRFFVEPNDTSFTEAAPFFMGSRACPLNALIVG